jgi:murein L,D-transpeptidase YcbB/YkuD
MKNIFLALILFSAPLFLSCNQNAQANTDNIMIANDEDFRKKLNDRLSSIDSVDLIFPYLKDNYDLIRSFYSNDEFRPILYKDFDSQKILDSLLYYFQNSHQHGINPTFYNSDKIIEEFNRSRDSKIHLDQRYYHLVNTELLLLNSIINYSVHLRQGFVNPKKLFAPDYEIPVRTLTQSEILEPIRTNDIYFYLESIQPKSERYLRLQEALKKFEGLLTQEWKTIPVPNSKIEPGDNYPYINQIVSKLILLGFIDTNEVKFQSVNKYEKNLIEPIKLFQKSHGLADDGVIGKATIERLNIPPKEYVEKIKINLERFRWNDYTDTSKYVLVNIPDFKLKVIENKKESFEIKVCTGRKNKWQTPVLYSQLSYLVLNPTWSVPQSIVQEEIIDGLKKDTLYLKKRNFKAYKGGKQVSLDEINIKELKTKRYTLIQDPGVGNALGKIKFMFDNQFGVYLHDTPTRAPFNYVNRAVSHGCVRVEKPFLLAEFLLKDNSDWTIDYIKIETGYQVSDKNLINEYLNVRNKLRKNYSYGPTTEVRLKNSIPVFIDYYTAWVDENGFLNYRDDVYEKDLILKKRLNF